MRPQEVRPADKVPQSSCLPIPTARVSMLLASQLLTTAGYCWSVLRQTVVSGS